MTEQNLVEDFSMLLDLLVDLIEVRAKTQITEDNEWLNGSQVLAIKLFRHLASMRVLASPTTVQYKKLSSIFFIDHSSLNVVARAAFETYLVFFFVYAQEDKQLAEFRYKLWCLAGLSDRQKLYVSSKEGRETISREAHEIIKLKSEIGDSSFFALYSEKQRRELLKGKWRIGNEWADLSRQAGFHERYFKDLYGYLCAYSHSSYLSALQVSAARDVQEQGMLTKMTMQIGCVLMAHFTFSFCRHVLASDEVLSTNTQGRMVAGKYYLRAENMAFIYGGHAGLVPSDGNP